MTTPQPAALPEPSLQQGKYGYRLSHEDYYTADQMRAYALATLQAQPAEVSDEHIERAAFEAWWKGDLTDWRGHQSVPAMHAWGAWQARAILALRPQAMPMDQEAAWKASPANSDWEAVDAYMQGIADAEAHHGITAQAKEVDRG